jgi:hypothetical protein
LEEGGGGGGSVHNTITVPWNAFSTRILSFCASLLRCVTFAEAQRKLSVTSLPLQRHNKFVPITSLPFLTANNTVAPVTLL